MSRRKNIHPYLSDDLYARFKRFVSATGATESSIVESALTEFLDQTSHKRLLLKQLGGLGRNMERIDRDLSIVMETLAAFVQIWMVHNPKPSEAREELQRKTAGPRFTAFQKFVARQLGGGRRFLNDVVQEPSVPAAEGDEPDGGTA
jgi:hypothetical protein